MFLGNTIKYYVPTIILEAVLLNEFPASHKHYTRQGMDGINLTDDRKLDYANSMLAPYTFCIKHIVSVDRWSKNKHQQRSKEESININI